MTTSLPRLDDRSFDALVDEGRRLLPLVAPAWTNHNPSDPGITLLEVLAYVCELLIYRLDQVDRHSRLGFLRLLRGANADSAGFDDLDAEAIDEAIATEVATLSRIERAVTPNDFERLAQEAAAAVFGTPTRVFGIAGLRIARFDGELRVDPRPADFTIVVLRPPGAAADDGDRFLQDVRDRLRPACLIASHAHVVDAVVLVVAIAATIRTHVHREIEAWVALVRGALTRYFSPYPGQGSQRDGWPFGHAVQIAHVFEAIATIEQITAIDDVRIVAAARNVQDLERDDRVVGIQVGIGAVGRTTRFGLHSLFGPDRLLVGDDGWLSGVALHPWELVDVTIRPDDLEVKVEGHPLDEQDR